MTLQELEAQLIKLPVSEKWKLVNTLLSSIKEDTASNTEETKETEKVYPLRGLPITISDDFDEPMSELWEALAE